MATPANTAVPQSHRDNQKALIGFPPTIQQEKQDQGEKTGKTFNSAKARFRPLLKQRAHPRTKKNVTFAVTTARRKTRKLRGSRCHGWGRSGQHRDSGMLGGHGNAGWKRHKWSAVIRYNLEIGERGFHPVRQKHIHAINVGDVALQLERLIQEGFAKQADNMVEVDLGKAGYQKLLGSGGVGQPLRIIVEKTSELAQEKIGKAGGEIVLPTKDKQD